MITSTKSFTISTRGKGVTEITPEVEKLVSSSGVVDSTATIEHRRAPHRREIVVNVMGRPRG